MIKRVVLTAAAILSVNTASAAMRQSDMTIKNAHKEVIVPKGMEGQYEQMQFAPATRAGDFLYLSGVVAAQHKGEEDMAPAMNRAFDEIETTLAAAGATWNNVVDVTSFHIDFDNSLPAMWAVKSERVKAPYPSWTVIGTTRLFAASEDHRPLVEIKVTAYLGD